VLFCARTVVCDAMQCQCSRLLSRYVAKVRAHRAGQPRLEPVRGGMPACLPQPASFAHIALTAIDPARIKQRSAFDA
jgi:hypothetical protein